MLRLEGVAKAYAGRGVVKPTTLHVGDGERVAIIGPSGSGKSTLLKMALGLVVPDEGTVTVAGERVTPESAPRIRRKLGYVVQDGGLFPHMTAEENVTLVARLARRAPAQIASRVGDLATLARLDAARLARFPAELSGGERQRVGLMRALMLDPGLLLLDEPLAALDPLVRARLQEDLRETFRSLGKAVLLVTHDMAEAAFLADRIHVVRDGAVVQSGSMRELVETPADPFVTELVSAQRSLNEALT